MTARILVVDDTPLNVKLLSAKLEHEYYVVATAANGPKALEMIGSDPPDLVLLDVMMPGMDGFEVCRQIKADSNTAHIPVVMVTALKEAEDRVKGLDAGADDFLTKPIDMVALTARVRSLLRLKTLMDEWRLREKTALQFTGTAGQDFKDHVPIEGGRIILLENGDGDREMIAAALAPLSAQVECVDKVGDAASMARTGFYDAVFASLSLKGEDALTICAQLRSQDVTRHIPIIFLALPDDVPKVAKGLDLGANDYLLRPLDANEVLARARTQLRHKKHYDSLRRNYEASLSLSLVDPLTGSFNRRYMEAHLPRMLERACQSARPLSVLMIDIDHFKLVNDRLGHVAGDGALKAVANLILNGVRPSDLVARMGGEEFIVIMPETPLTMAGMVAERLRAKIAASPIIIEQKPDGLNITVSIGAAETGGKGRETQAALIERADAALYEAKHEGRNRVVTG